MFNSLELINFQSHKKTRLDFHAGVNAIVGVSDSGKSAILRSIHWVRENRPTGTAHISHFVKDAKGKVLENCEATLVINGTPIKRIRGEKENSYIVEGKPLEAMGVKVPQEVTDIFNFSEVNVHKQMDAPFLLSKSGGEVARFFSSVVKLDDMTKIVSHAKKLEADETKERKSKEKRAKDLERELKGFEWIDEAKPILDTVILLENSLADKKTQAGDIVHKIEAIGVQNAKIAECEPILKAAEILAQTKAIHNSVEAKKSTVQKVVILTSAIQTEQTRLSTLEPILKAIEPTIELKKIVAGIEGKQAKKASLNRVVNAIAPIQAQIERANKFLICESQISLLSESKKAIVEKQNRAKNLKETILSAKNAEKLQKQALNVVLNAPNLQEIKDLQTSIANKNKTLSGLSRVLGAIGVTQTIVNTAKDVISELEKKLPEKCTQCGQYRVKHPH